MNAPAPAPLPTIDRRITNAQPALEQLGVDMSGDLDEIYRQLSSTRTGKYARLFTTNAYKARLSMKKGVLSGVQYLAPDRQSGITAYRSCPWASEGCSSTCLTGTGHMVTDIAAVARRKRTLRWYLDPVRTARDLSGELRMLEGKAFIERYDPTIRLNGTSDRPFWQWVDHTAHAVQFYDYTKMPPTRPLLDLVASGWHLTFSLSESPRSMRQSRLWAAAGVNTAIVVSGPSGSVRGKAKKIAEHLVKRGEFAGRPTIDGDIDDLRWLDPADGGWVVLAAKGGLAKTESHGFVVRFDPDRLLGTDCDPVDALLSPFDHERFTPTASAVAAK